jgi:hypothetical protein
MRNVDKNDDFSVRLAADDYVSMREQLASATVKALLLGDIAMHLLVIGGLATTGAVAAYIDMHRDWSTGEANLNFFLFAAGIGLLFASHHFDRKADCERETADALTEKTRTGPPWRISPSDYQS